MNSLTEFYAGFIADKASLEALSTAPSARVLLLSDTHGYYEQAASIIDTFAPQCDALLYAGDGIDDLIYYFEKAALSEKMRESLPAVIALVSGNCDANQYNLSLEQLGKKYSISIPRYQIITVAGHRIFLTHGHFFRVDFGIEQLFYTSLENKCTIAVHGHTHIQYSEDFQGADTPFTVINPGSPVKPRGNSKPGFALMDIVQEEALPKVTLYALEKNFFGEVSYTINSTAF